MGKWTNAVMLSCAVFGTVFTFAILYLAAVPFFGWWPAPPLSVGPVPVTASYLISPIILWFFGLLGVALLATAWILYREKRPSSFFKDWPDAIRCTWKEEQSSDTVPSTFIFYLKGEAAARQNFGRVTMYFMPGGQRHVQQSDGQWAALPYLPHELWFSTIDKALLRPDGIADNRLDRDGVRYKQYFLTGIQCGGETIAEIKQSGNTFSFARRWK